ncbi:hypothetical protein RhiirA5_434199 [Rhizophagus irregularis]|uniref:Uncharacterized protein n=1 Tax=Rhizophagus irregularis TaxID=588596 RepID=A0A2I1FGX4_9GLOM|nr:hypothetical protein RhiirA5_434199 [Rhizophagus irregularis]PKC56218.1 hypothetical protein RhiirA1_474327 [Rhizophagus irregularis]PKY33636.1 hypothetical protein RhiirB3_452697 [Rhizophagus irregularis]CAB4491939.1 unnamed protein product [Rhizophagus irregularis]CAB5205825.1 unnamed protein product [Rhizophagus irregularis]
MTNNNTRVTPKTRTERKSPAKFLTRLPRTFKTATRPIHKTRTFKAITRPIHKTRILVLMGHNINGIGPDDFKLNILIDYCANKRADIVGIVETNKDRKYGKFWNKQNPEYISF